MIQFAIHFCRCEEDIDAEDIIEKAAKLAKSKFDFKVSSPYVHEFESQCHENQSSKHSIACASLLDKVM